MPIAPTARIDPRASIAPDASIGDYCVIESDVSIGAAPCPPGDLERARALMDSAR